MEVKQILKEGEFFNKWARTRFKRNKNIIGSITGETGSSKTYDALSLCENYYKNELKKPFPIENVCFSIGEVAKRLKSSELKKAELIILEEGGANLGALDFQNRIIKIFTYILQSFRSMNIGLIITLPVLTMLNKQTRQLIHFNFITCGIDFQKEIATVKPFFHQLNQQMGKSYWKYPRVIHNGRKIILSRLTFSKPTECLINVYETKKTNFVGSLTDNFIEEYNRLEREKNIKEARKNLTDIELETYNLIQKGKNVKEIAKVMGVTNQTTYRTLIRIKKKGYITKISKNTKENHIISS